MQQIQHITGRNDKKENHGWTYEKKEVLLEPVWIGDAFEFCVPELYKLVTTVTRYDYSQYIYTVPVVQCNQHT